MLFRPTFRGTIAAAADTWSARQEALMKFELREASPNCVVVTCRGGLSWEDRELLAANVEQYLAGREDGLDVVMDMGGVEFVNSAGLGALFQLVQRLRSRRGQLAFANIPPSIRRLLTTVGMERLSKFADTVSDAISILAEARQSPDKTDSDRQAG